jgi:hypothetical protein
VEGVELAMQLVQQLSLRSGFFVVPEPGGTLADASSFAGEVFGVVDVRGHRLDFGGQHRCEDLRLRMIGAVGLSSGCGR